MKRDLETKLEEARQLVVNQGQNGNWNYDPYMHGMFNGMEFILSIFEEREPQYKTAPERWLADKGRGGTHFLTTEGSVPPTNDNQPQ